MTSVNSKEYQLETLFTNLPADLIKKILLFSGNWLCDICGNYCSGYGNNAYPVKDGKCCDWCNNMIVIRVRMGLPPSEIYWN